MGHEPSAHGGDCLVQNPQQGSLTIAGAYVARQFQVPAALVVHYEKLPEKIGLNSRKVFDLLALGFTDIVDQCPGGPHAGFHGLASEPFQRKRVKLLQQSLTASGKLE